MSTNPISISTTSLVISFIGFGIVLNYTKPYYVLINDNNQQPRLNRLKIFIYSLLFANVVAIISLLLFTTPNTHKHIKNKDAYSPEFKFSYSENTHKQKLY